MSDYPIHPYADEFPLIDSEELGLLAQSIHGGGQQQPIVIDGLGRVIDGRNRLAACRLAGVEPVTVTLPHITTDAQVAAFISSANNNRRHMTRSQVLAAEALLLHLAGARRNGHGLRNRGRWVGITKEWRAAFPNSATRMSELGLIVDMLGPDALRDIIHCRAALDAKYREAQAAAQSAVYGEPPDPEPAAAPAEVPDPELPDQDSEVPDSIDRAERRIRRRLRDNARDLAAIQANRDWWKPYPTFWAYCEKHLGLTRDQAEAWLALAQQQ